MKFVTINEGTKNVDLMKDVGQIPFQLHKMFNIDSHIATFNYGTYSYLQDEVKGLKIDFLPLIFGRKIGYLAVFFYLLKEAKKIDVLHLFHLKKRSIIYGFIYLFFNRKGKLYYKFDCPKPEIDFRVKNAFLPVKLVISFMGMIMMKKCAFISVETKSSYDNIRRISKDKMLLIPNAFDDSLPDKKNIKVKSFKEKDDLIVLVARHGDHAKNSELMLNALPLTKIQKWKIRFIGSCSSMFMDEYKTLIQKFPELEKNIVLEGYVADKTQLYNYYNAAKIICLPSRSEGFPNSIAEAIYFGAVPVLADHLPASWDLTDNGRAGLLFKNESQESLAEALNALICNQNNLKAHYESTLEHSRKNFLWKNVIPSIYKKMTS
jgi:glycosyltransferase involved in cell wall biosynthesis